jgi:hypothetical protein
VLNWKEKTSTKKNQKNKGKIERKKNNMNFDLKTKLKTTKL